MANNALPPIDTTTRQTNGPSQPAVNGNTQTSNNGAPTSVFPIGHQQDLNFLYHQIQELGILLQSNREKVDEVTRNAEQVAAQKGQTANGQGDPSDGSDGALQAARARIQGLTEELTVAQKSLALHRHEQSENTALIGLYEETLSRATESIRTYADTVDERFLAQRRRYNEQLQQERDDHLATRLDRDEWYQKCLQVCGMIREAYRLRSEEWNRELTVVKALQEEVRCYRKCLGLESESREDESGALYLEE